MKKNKPLIILFNGFASSKLFWEYNYNFDNSSLEKNNFLKRLHSIGDVFTFNSNFFGILKYSTPKGKIWDKIVEKYFASYSVPLEDKKWPLASKKYKPYSSDINFTIESLDYKKICNCIYNRVVAKYGKNRRYIVIGHSYGSELALLFSKLYKKQCDLCVCIDNPVHLLEYFHKYDQHQYENIIKKNFSDNSLPKMLEKIKASTLNKSNVNKEIDIILKMIVYKAASDRIKYYDDKLYVPTLFFRAFYSDPNNKFKKEWNYYAIKEKNLEK